jgi:argininosuccinate lyase
MTKNNNTSINDKKSNIWGGRFSSGPSQLMQDINASINYDQRLYKQDIAGSKAHATMLAACNIISEDDCQQIHK